MLEPEEKAKVQDALAGVSRLLRKATDAEVAELLGEGQLDEFIRAVAPRKTGSENSIYEYLLFNKKRLTLVSLLRYSITRNYSIRGKIEDGREVFVAPAHFQWFDDGVIFLQGSERFGGNIGLFQNGEVQFAIAARDVAREEGALGPDDFLFVSIVEMQKRLAEQSVPRTLAALNHAVDELEEMLERRVEAESEYHKLIQENAWIFGLQYRRIDSHLSLDDRNIPDFTGIRVRDGARDVFEIKQPFLSLFRNDGRFRSEFNDSWNQAEAYLDFVRRESEYLRRQKSLRFENSRCVLITGNNLSSSEIGRLRAKERMNPSITIITYNDLVALATNTVKFVAQHTELGGAA